MRFVIRVDRMGGKVEIRGLAVGDEKIYRFERTVKDVVDSSKLPVRITMENGLENRDDLAEKLGKVFSSDHALEGKYSHYLCPLLSLFPFQNSSLVSRYLLISVDMIRDLKLYIIQKLIPKLQQEDYVEIAEAENTATTERRAQETRNPLAPFPRGSIQPNAPFPHPSLLPDLAVPRPGAPVGDFPPPGFDDEYEMNPRFRDFHERAAERRLPPNIGHDDLNPPPLHPESPFAPAGGRPRPGWGSGMHPTFDDPLFMGSGGGFGPSPSPGSGFGPPSQAPPGARWDPIGPGSGRRNNGFSHGDGGFGGNGFGGTGFGGNGFGGSNFM